LAALLALAAVLAGCAAPVSTRRTAHATRPPTQVVSPTPVGAPAGPTAGAAPARAFAVGRRTDTFVRAGNRQLPTTTWYPTTGGQPAPGRFPLVLFSHGLGGVPEDYTSLLTRWASAGFVVTAPRYPYTHRGSKDDLTDVLNQPADASYVLSQILAGPLRDHLDPAHLAAAGHSAGGITTVGLFTRARDERLRAGVVLAGNALGFGTDFTGPVAPLLFVHGDADGVVPYAMGRAVYEKVPWPKALLTLPGQGHLIFSGTPAWTVMAVTTVDFLRWTLYGDPAARGRLTVDAGPAATLVSSL
jgi:predicted dienelactone hydrolase